jgi:hypothetical protein
MFLYVLHIDTNSKAWFLEQDNLIKRTIPTDQPPLVNVVPTFADRGCCVVSITDPHGRILGFLDRSRYYFFKVAPQLYS